MYTYDPHTISKGQQNVIGYFLWDIKAPKGAVPLSSLDRTTASDLVKALLTKRWEEKVAVVNQLKYLDILPKDFNLVAT